MAPKRAAMAGAGILGNLQYNDNAQSWLIKLGQFLAIYELAQTKDASSRVAQTKLEARTAIDQILAEQGIPFTLPVSLTLTCNEAINRVSALLSQVELLGGASHVAVVLIAECSCILRWEPVLGAECVLGFARDRLNDIRHWAPGLDLATDALWEFLRSQPPQELTTPGTRLLLMELSKPLVILIVSADAKDATRLRVAEERRELHEALRLTRFRDSFTIRDMPSCRIRDIASALDDHNPDILLFTGHGSSNGLCFEDNSGRVSVVRKANLATLLGHQENLKLVILNACYSQDQAQCIADATGYVIGMEGSIRDTDAINFSREFFTALGYGRTFEASFKRARDAVGLDSSSTLKPHFLKAQPGGPVVQQPATVPPPSLFAALKRKPRGMGFWYYLTASLVMLCAFLFCISKARL